jgi:hypothetical protein
MAAGGRHRDLDIAAERVLAAQKALDARRHASALTLEREYQRALEAYFEVSQRAEGRLSDATGEPMWSAPLPIAEEDEDDELTAEEEARVEQVQRLATAIAGHYAAARHAIRLARAYEREPGTSGRRERECIQAVKRHRDAVRWLRIQSRRSGEQLALPGLVKARPALGARDTRVVRTARSG